MIMISKVIKLPRVYTNPPCNDRESYHRSDQNSMRHVDQRKKLCYLCDSKADIIINKTTEIIWKEQLQKQG